MASFTITAAVHTVEVSVTDPAQLAALETETYRHNEALKEGDPKTDGEGYLNFVMSDWAVNNKAATKEDVEATIFRALRSYAGQPEPQDKPA